MSAFEPITPDTLSALSALDTPTVCNALEAVAPARRGIGYTVEPLLCTRPELPPMVGYARTATIRGRQPAQRSAEAAQAKRRAYYRYIAEGSQPGVVVIQDLDGPNRGYGAFWGEVNSAIHYGLGCKGVITDGSVRDLPDNAPNFQMLADRIGPSHAHVHIEDFSCPVVVAGMAVENGDLIHADQHGAVVIPPGYADKIAAAAALISRREAVILTAARAEDFSIDTLEAAMADAAEIH